MVKKENVESHSNSLLQTATNKRLGASKLALLALRSTVRPPVKRVRVPRSNESRVSDLTASINEEARPALVKEIRISDIEVESSILGMSMNSSSSSTFSVTKAFSGRDHKKSTTIPSVGKAIKTTPQPKAFLSPTPAREVNPLQKKSMEIQKGIRISAPSPMSLDRVQVQMGQERVVPESKEYKQHQAEVKKKQEKELKKIQHEKAKEEAKEQLRKAVEKEQGEGFEAQLGDFSPDIPIGKKKSLVKKILEKIKPKSPRKKPNEPKDHPDSPARQRVGPLNAAEARSLARKALDASKQKRTKTSLQGPYNQTPTQTSDEFALSKFPVNEILMKTKEDSISDLDASVRKFPVNEILMNEGEQARDDESVSTLGTPRVFDKIDSLAMSRSRKMEQRDPMPASEIEAIGQEAVFLQPGIIYHQLGQGAENKKGPSPAMESAVNNFRGSSQSKENGVEGGRNNQQPQASSGPQPSNSLDASRLHHRNGNALIDQIDSVSALTMNADATAASDGTEAIEMIMGSCDPTRPIQIQKNPQWDQTGGKGNTSLEYTLAAMCQGTSTGQRRVLHGNNGGNYHKNEVSVLEKDVESRIQHLSEAHDKKEARMLSVLDSAPVGLESGFSSTKVFDTPDRALPESNGPPLSPTSAFSHAIDAAIRHVETQMRDSSATDNEQRSAKAELARTSEYTSTDRLATTPIVVASGLNGIPNGGAEPKMAIGLNGDSTKAFQGVDLQKNLSPIVEDDELVSSATSPRGGASRQDWPGNSTQAKSPSNHTFDGLQKVGLPENLSPKSNKNRNVMTDQRENCSEEEQSNDESDHRSLPDLENIEGKHDENVKYNESNENDDPNQQLTRKKGSRLMSTLAFIGADVFSTRSAASKQTRMANPRNEETEPEGIIDLTNFELSSPEHNTNADGTNAAKVYGSTSPSSKDLEPNRATRSSHGPLRKVSSASHSPQHGVKIGFKNVDDIGDAARNARETQGKQQKLKSVPDGAQQTRPAVAFSFDDFMDIAALKLRRSGDRVNPDDRDDRYAIEGDESPRQVIVGQCVESNASDESIPVVQGVEVTPSNPKSTTEVTPKASGGSKDHFFLGGGSRSKKNRGEQLAASSDSENKKTGGNEGREIELEARSINSKVISVDGSDDNSFEVYDDPEGDVVICYEDNPHRLTKGTKEEVDVENDGKYPTRQPTTSPNEQSACGSGGFAGYFSDGLFDLLSVDESMARAPKKSSKRLRASRKTSQRQTKHESDQMPRVNEHNFPSARDGEEHASVPLHRGSAENLRLKANPDVLDYVFEYSEMVICGNDPGATKRSRRGSNTANARGDKHEEPPNSTRGAIGEEVVLEDESYDASTQADTSMIKDGLDPSLGVMCGAVPLYFMYSPRNSQDHQMRPERRTLPRRKAQDKSEVLDNNSGADDTQTASEAAPPFEETTSQLDDDGIISVESSQASSYRKSQNVMTPAIKHSAAKSGRVSQSQECVQGPTQSVSFEGRSHSSKEWKKAPTPARTPGGGVFGPVGSPREREGSCSDRASQSSRRRKEGPPAPERGGKRDKVLLDKDDEYWDTLSTIASTRDRSSDDEKIAPVTVSNPGPIPVEITMTGKELAEPKKEGVRAFQISSGIVSGKEVEETKQVAQSIGKLNCLIGEDRSGTSLSYSLENYGAAESKQVKHGRDKPSTGKNSNLRRSPTKTQSGSKDPTGISRAGSISADESLHGPPSHSSSNAPEQATTRSIDSVSRNSRVANLIARFEAARGGAENSEVSSSQDGSTGDTGNEQRQPVYVLARKESDFSEDNSALLLAVTRSEADSVKLSDSNPRMSHVIEKGFSARPYSEENGERRGRSSDEAIVLITGNNGNNASSSELSEERQLPHNQDTRAESLAVHSHSDKDKEREAAPKAIETHTPGFEHQDSEVQGIYGDSSDDECSEDYAIENARSNATQKQLNPTWQKAVLATGTSPSHHDVTTGYHNNLQKWGTPAGLHLGALSSSFASSWKNYSNSHRSVSWGFEEIYEAPEPQDSSAASLDQNQVVAGDYVDRNDIESTGVSTLVNTVSNSQASKDATPVFTSEKLLPESNNRLSKSIASQRNVTWGFEETYEPNPSSSALIEFASLSDNADAAVTSTESSRIKSAPAIPSQNFGETIIDVVDDNNKQSSIDRAVISAIAAAAAGKAVAENWGSSLANLRVVREPNQESQQPRSTTPFSTVDDQRSLSQGDGTQSLHSGSLLSRKSTAESIVDNGMAAVEGTPDIHSGSSEVEIRLRSLLSKQIMEQGGGKGDSTVLNYVDEQQLIARTLKLSKELLSSMSAHDLNEADDEVVKSLMSFGTEEDSATMLSLSLIQQPQNCSVPQSVLHELSIGEGSSQILSGSQNSISVRDESSTDDGFILPDAWAKGDNVQSEVRIPLPISILHDHLPPSVSFHTLSSKTANNHTSAQAQIVNTLDLEETAGLEKKGSSVRTVSEVSNDSPINVQRLFVKYDKLAHHLIEENDELKMVAQNNVHESGSTSNHTPKVLNRLDELRSQRAQALARYQFCHTPNTSLTETPNQLHKGRDASEITRTGVQTIPGTSATPLVNDRRDRDRLRYYSSNRHSTAMNAMSTDVNSCRPRPTSAGRPRPVGGQYDFQSSRRARSAGREVQYLNPIETGDYDDRDIESVSTSSDSAKTTPSRKARELRRQLDEALQASKEIRMSQEKLGDELRTFKNRFYRRNDELEGQAMRAIGVRRVPDQRAGPI